MILRVLVLVPLAEFFFSYFVLRVGAACVAASTTVTSRAAADIGRRCKTGRVCAEATIPAKRLAALNRSIDTARYMARGRRMRSEEAHRLARRTTSRLLALAVAAVTVLAALLILPMAT